MKIRALSVTELNKYIKRTLDIDPILSSLTVIGEVSNYKLHSSGHTYFTLKDEDSKINCVLFSRDASHNTLNLENGQSVKVKGYISVYPRDGKYQLYVKEIESNGIGTLYEKFEFLKNELKKRGYFDSSLKKEIPEFPKKIAVITSPTGSAIRDIINVIKRRTKRSDILVIPVRVQGKESSVEIVNAIKTANSLSDIDLIILARGGGSIEELWSFNEENVAVEIFKSSIPVISGVGHETDFTIADLVSDLRAPTPSAAAELAVKNEIMLIDELHSLYLSIKNQIKRNLYSKRSEIKYYSKEQLLKNVSEKINIASLEIDSYYDKVKLINTFKLNDYRNTLNSAIALMNALNPLELLGKGYVITEKNNLLINSVKMLKNKDTICIKYIDGIANCEVRKIEEGENYGK
ncbi:exodeoxyribonuclease VII large subunit [Helicovermis profundi]|uniref:Exodeoxyribonuclease 7 large subunit n=1 Tax=Helicovermis profundi TaxID=3065157 RepID=A0AAU9E4R0_9FIRM|nr:exodeoxyribonuclease VII large subunit [Clostridia bacterium S502]